MNAHLKKCAMKRWLRNLAQQNFKSPRQSLSQKLVLYKISFYTNSSNLYLVKIATFLKKKAQKAYSQFLRKIIICNTCYFSLQKRKRKQCELYQN